MVMGNMTLDSQSRQKVFSMAAKFHAVNIGKDVTRLGLNFSHPADVAYLFL
jgi:hypothetical protein